MKKIILIILGAIVGIVAYTQVNTIFTPPWSYVGVPPTVSTMMNAIQPYKKIVMRVTQSSTTAPVDTTLEDNQSTSHSWSRLHAGGYRIFCDDCFSTHNTLVIPGNTVADANIRAWVISSDSIGIEAADSSAVLRDGKLTNTPLEIRMYQ